MSPDSNWDDPFLEEDPAARERARRRAEREARRAKRRGDVAKKVQEAQSEAEAAAEPPTGQAPAQPALPPDPAPPAEPGRGLTPPDGQPAHASPAEPVPSEPMAEKRPPDGRKATTAERDEVPAAPATTPPHRPPRSVVHRRRLAALLGLAALAFAGLVVVVAANRLGADDPPPAEVFKEQKTIDVTIPEGYSRSQIAEVAKKAGIKGDYEAASKSVKGFNPGKYGAGDPESLEGFLFPATYEEFKGKTKAEDLVKDQLDAFKENIKGVDFGYAKSKNLTQYDVLTIASMIEREVQVPEERPKVAAVIYNRLAQGMPLGIDATIRFAVDNFTKPLTQSELAVDSPYNTRAVAGLPPGPIGNPGLESIEAAAKPAKANFLYYVVKPGTCGEHVFTASEDEFNQAAAEYEAAREAAGGKSPDNC